MDKFLRFLFNSKHFRSISLYIWNDWRCQEPRAKPKQFRLKCRHYLCASFFFEPGSFVPHSHAQCMEIRWEAGSNPGGRALDSCSTPNVCPFPYLCAGNKIIISKVENDRHDHVPECSIYIWTIHVPNCFCLCLNEACHRNTDPNLKLHCSSILFHSD